MAVACVASPLESDNSGSTLDSFEEEGSEEVK